MGCREVSPSLLTPTCLVPTRVAFPCAGGERVFTAGLYETQSRGHTDPGPLTLEGNVEIELRHWLDLQANQSYRLGTGRCELGTSGPTASGILGGLQQVEAGTSC